MMKKLLMILVLSAAFVLWVLAATEWCYRDGCLDTAADKSL